MAEKCNVNEAGREESMQLDGVGEALADRILEKRGRRGGFETAEDLDAV